MLTLVATAAPPLIPGLREQATLQQAWLKHRLDFTLIDMWIVSSREYNEDPVFYSLVSPTMFAARRRTIYVFFDRGGAKGIERLALGGGSQGGLYEVYRDPDTGIELYGDSQWVLLKKLIDERKPNKIAIDISQIHAFSDGLSAGEREQLEESIGPENRKKLVRAEGLALDFVAVRAPAMVPVYRGLMEHMHSILSRAFSNEVIPPGKTTDQDVVWWLRQENQRLGIGTWFQPGLRVQRQNGQSLQMLQQEETPITIDAGTFFGWTMA